MMGIYLTYHYKHSNKQEKQRMQNQKQAYHQYYDQWYTPASSTYLENEADKIKKRKKSNPISSPTVTKKLHG
jgi:hypothetical protein